MVFNKTIENIEITDLNLLISQVVREDQNLEYKREYWGNSDDNKKEMLRDITAMANKYGGYIILGLDEDDETNAAKQFMNVPDADTLRDAIYASCLANISPRLSLKFKILHDEVSEADIILIFVPNSYQAPHMITFQGKNEIWVRHDRQKTRMSVEEIKEVITKNLNIATKAEEFLKARWETFIQKGHRAPLLVLGALPLNIDSEFIDIKDQQLRELLRRSPNGRYGGAKFDFGLNVYPGPTINGLKISIEDYMTLEIYRNGYLEGEVNINNFLEEGKEKEVKNKVIFSWALVEYIYSFLSQLKQLGDYFGYNGQYLVFVKLFGIQGFGLKPYKHKSFMNSVSIWNEFSLEINSIVINEVNPEEITKQLSDRLWQAFGFENEPYYKDGKFNFGE